MLKENSNQRYATSAVTSLPLRIIAQKHNIPLQVRAVSSAGGVRGSGSEGVQVDVPYGRCAPQERF